ncbi:NAD-dependent 4,6-dehydratase LegB [Pseudomonadota bacterium]|nr:NAD-dependent 4,6-dehydratase LegB [Pseudomonadota bacterium]
MKKKKIFVTGADGFIGSHLVEELVHRGYEVKALAQYNSFNSYGWLDDINSQTRKNFEKILGDIRDFSQMLEIMKGCEVVFHLASLIGIPYSYYAPQSYIDTNVTGTVNILQASRLNDVSKIIHTSTSEVYGTAQFVPIKENHPLNGQSPYSASKIGADQMAFSFFSSFDSPVSICRPFNTYGPRQSTRAVIPSIIVQLINGAETVKLGNIHSTRDFNFIKDTISGFIAIMLNEKSVGQVYNIGSNYEVSIEKVFNIISKKFNLNSKIEIQDSRKRPEKSEVERLWADNSKAILNLDWTPQYSNLSGFEKGIDETIKWFQSDENINKYKNTGYVT